MEGSKVFVKIDNAPGAESAGNYLLFIAKCFGVHDSEDLLKIRKLRTALAQQEYDSEAARENDLGFLSKVAEVLRDYYTNWTDISAFEECTSCAEVLAAMTGATAAKDDRTPALGDSLPTGWLAQSGFTSVQRATHTAAFYDEQGLLQHAEASRLPDCKKHPEFRFVSVMGMGDLLLMLQEAKGSLKMKLSKALVVGDFDGPAVIGILPTDYAGDKTKVRLGSSSVNVQFSRMDRTGASLKGNKEDKETKQAILARLHEETDWYASKKVVDPVTGLPYKLIMV